MTKRWSATASLDGQTKREASKKARRAVGDIYDEGCDYPDCECVFRGGRRECELVKGEHRK